MQIGKVSKNKNTNKPRSHSAEINKWIAGTLKLPTYLQSQSPQSAKIMQVYRVKTEKTIHCRNESQG